jgi:hypothetical protein
MIFTSPENLNVMARFKTLLIACSLLLTGQAFAQKAWIEPSPTVVSDTITLWVDIAQCDNQSCLDLGPLYIWTWQPAEHAEGHPLVNGTGSRPWKNSNDALEMSPHPTRPNVWFYKMVPTDFYEVDAAAVYKSGISFLAKPKDGGGYGDPDLKTEDLVLAVIPPPQPSAVYVGMPANPKQDDVFTLIYDNNIEEKEAMQNLPEGDAYIIPCVTADSVNYDNMTNFFQVINDDKFKMEYKGDGIFYYTFVPEDYFSGVIPAGAKISQMDFIIRRKSNTARIEGDVQIPLCED